MKSKKSLLSSRDERLNKLKELFGYSEFNQCRIDLILEYIKNKKGGKKEERYIFFQVIGVGLSIILGAGSFVGIIKNYLNWPIIVAIGYVITMCLLLMAAVVTILRIIESNLNDDEKIMLELLKTTYTI